MTTASSPLRPQEDARLVGKRTYPEIAETTRQEHQDYKTFSGECSWLAHAWFYDPAGKYRAAQKERPAEPVHRPPATRLGAT